MTRDLTFKWSFPHPPADVWECLTNPEIISEWLMKNNFKAEVGHRFQFQTRPIPNMKFDGNVYCEVLEIIPLQKLVYSWKGGPAPGVVELDTILTWTLTPTADGTELVLEHKGFKGFRNYIASVFMGSGWNGKIRKRFIQVLNHYAHAQG